MQNELVVVVDNKNKPLCHMPMFSASAQNLVWQTAAFALKVKGEGFVFRFKSALEVTLPVEGAVPAGVAPIDFCINGILKDWPVPELDWKKNRVISPCKETGFTFCQIYFAKVWQRPPQGADFPFFTARQNDLLALRGLGCALSPLLEYLFIDNEFF